MSEPLLPHRARDDENGDNTSRDAENAPAAAEPGPGAPGTPPTEEPDILPGQPSNQQSDDLPEAEQQESPDLSQVDTPFRTPDPGASLTPEQLAERATKTDD